MTLDISATVKFFDITTWGAVNNPSTAFIKYTVVCSVAKKVDETAEWEEVFSTKKNRTQKYSDSSEALRTDSIDISSRISLNEGDYVGVKMSIENIDTSGTSYSNGGTLPDHQVICRVKGDFINLGNGTEKNTQMELAEGDLLEFNHITLPATLQFDLIKEVMKLFNLVTYTNVEQEKTIHFCTYDEYFSKALPQNILQNAVDWSDKIDVSNYSIKPLTNISKKYKWTFAEGQDYLNTTYFEKYKEVYGTKNMDGIIDYKEDIKTIESSFVPSIVTKINDLNLPLIYKYSADNLKESYSSELRILFYKGLKTVFIERGKWKKGKNNTYTFQHDGKWLFNVGEVTTLYSDENDVSKNFDLTFGIPFEMYSQTTTINKNIYDKFYEKIILEQNNRDIHILECSIYLNHLDISNLDLSVPVLFLQNQELHIIKF
ncbi:hypothetical protein [Sphingobacterium sp. IITKGP-BTPF85]|uniref:hypothetical protein n=1 Tax=Sphingobacterium sp. IITKGP-BTPF85 TaxID=1338009 RepID=UPI000389EAD6|nr:hypothetical protein [Sphingobacterium sp. IITKGP-BTPF85]KKX48338.1 hypothetical protein L950_0221540 [Sphingobacterium sp. IITKGP-BTPF85]